MVRRLLMVSAMIILLAVCTFSANYLFADDIGEVRAQIEAWRTAWQSKDIDAFMAFYSPSFRSSGNYNYERWKKRRSGQFEKPGYIKVAVENLDITPSGTSVMARFRQVYSTPTYSDRGTKTLLFQKSGSSWKIVSEEWVEGAVPRSEAHDKPMQEAEGTASHGVDEPKPERAELAETKQQSTPHQAAAPKARPKRKGDLKKALWPLLFDADISRVRATLEDYTGETANVKRETVVLDGWDAQPTTALIVKAVPWPFEKTICDLMCGFYRDSFSVVYLRMYAAPDALSRVKHSRYSLLALERAEEAVKLGSNDLAAQWRTAATYLDQWAAVNKELTSKFGTPLPFDDMIGKSIPSEGIDGLARLFNEARWKWHEDAGDIVMVHFLFPGDGDWIHTLLVGESLEISWLPASFYEEIAREKVVKMEGVVLPARGFSP